MSYHILIVADSANGRAVVKKSINMSGIDVATVFEAENGREALDVLNNAWIDIVFADINMPEMNGIELVEKMSEDALLVGTPVVIISSGQRQATINAVKERGICTHMKKPFQPGGFKEVICSILEENSRSDAQS